MVVIVRMVVGPKQRLKARRGEGLPCSPENSPDMKLLGFLVSLVAGLTAVGAGAYLLALQSESGPTWLEVIAHGSGAFFIACGLYMFGSSVQAAGDL